MPTRIRRLITGLLFSAPLLASQTSQAIEPQNDQAPWKWWIQSNDITLYTAHDAGAGWSVGVESIASSSDVDYIYLACDGRPVRAASVDFTHARGDIDIYVYDLAGNLLGISQGVTDHERVDVSRFGTQLVVVKVYGYNGAINDYGLHIEC